MWCVCFVFDDWIVPELPLDCAEDEFCQSRVYDLERF
jgi:hypothetical protein